MRRTLENLRAFLRRDTPEHTESLALMFALELIESVENLLLGFVPNAARVVEKQIGFRWAVCLRIPARQQGPDDLLRIMDVHLTAERLDVKLLHLFCNLLLGLTREREFCVRDPNSPNVDFLQVRRANTECFGQQQHVVAALEWRDTTW